MSAVRGAVPKGTRAVPDTRTTLIFRVRHGRAVLDVAGAVRGDVDVPLPRETAETIAGPAGFDTRLDDRVMGPCYGQGAGAAPGVTAATDFRRRGLAAPGDLARADGTAVAVSHDAVVQAALAAMGPVSDGTEAVLRETGCFNTTEARVGADGPSSSPLLGVSGPGHAQATPSKEERWPSQ